VWAGECLGRVTGEYRMPGSSAAETRARQDAFISAYSLVGSFRKSCEGIDISRNTVRSWIHTDQQGFKARYREAQEEFREFLQDIAVERVKDQKPNDNPVLLITLLNAHWPEKYRRDAYHADNAAKEIMGEWKKWVKDSKKAENKKAREDEKSIAHTEKEEAIQEAQKILSRKFGDNPHQPA